MRNFLTNISYNRLNSIDFDNALFIIDCFTYVLFKLNPFFLEKKFDDESHRAYVKLLWNCLVPNEFCIYICRNDNFIVLNKLSLKYQNAFDIVNNFILEENTNSVLLKDFFKKSALLYQYIYSNLLPKYFCRIDDYGVKSKMAFEVANAGYQNQQENLCFVQLPVEQEKIETDELSEAVKCPPPPLCSPSKLTTQKPKKRKIKNSDFVAEKILLKKKATCRVKVFNYLLDS